MSYRNVAERIVTLTKEYTGNQHLKDGKSHPAASCNLRCFEFMPLMQQFKEYKLKLKRRNNPLPDSVPLLSDQEKIKELREELTDALAAELGKGGIKINE